MRRLDAVVQTGLVIALAEAYRLLRRLLPTDWPQAIANAHYVLRLEQVSHVEPLRRHGPVLRLAVLAQP